jgi:hypothetical protein
MRLNRGTLVLGLVSIIVIAAVILLSNQPGGLTVTGTPTATAQTAGPLFPEISTTDKQSGIVRFEIDNNTDQSKVVMTKDAASVWTVSEATHAQQLATDQTKAVGMMSNLAALTAVETFTTDKVSDFGLDKPTYTLTLTDSAGKTYSIKVGNKATTSPRYYVLKDDDAKNVYLVQSSTIDMLIGNIAIPAYVASPTPSPTFTATANPYSEVEQTATAAVEQANLAITLTAYASITPGTPEATTEATGEVTAESTAQVAPAATTAPATATPQPTATKVPPSATPTATPTVTASPTTGS